MNLLSVKDSQVWVKSWTVARSFLCNLAFRLSWLTEVSAITMTPFWSFFRALKTGQNSPPSLAPSSVCLLMHLVRSEVRGVIKQYNLILFFPLFLLTSELPAAVEENHVEGWTSVSCSFFVWVFKPIRNTLRALLECAALPVLFKGIMGLSPRKMCLGLIHVGETHKMFPSFFP